MNQCTEGQAIFKAVERQRNIQYMHFDELLNGELAFLNRQTPDIKQREKK